MAKNTAGGAENGRKRHNISMAEDTRQRAEALAEVEKRSLSNLLEVLVDREFERLAKEGKISEKQAKVLAA